jgi:adenosine deaminase
MSTIAPLLASRGKYNDETERFIQNIPKVELHIHLAASFSQEILYCHLQQKQVPIQYYTALGSITKASACQRVQEFQPICPVGENACLQK